MALVMNASAAMPAGGTLGVAAARKGRVLHLDVTTAARRCRKRSGPTSSSRTPVSMPSGERTSGSP